MSDIEPEASLGRSTFLVARVAFYVQCAATALFVIAILTWNWNDSYSNGLIMLSAWLVGGAALCGVAVLIAAGVALSRADMSGLLGKATLYGCGAVFIPLIGYIVVTSMVRR